MVHIDVGDDDARTLRLIPHGSWEERPLQEVAP